MAASTATPGCCTTTTGSWYSNEPYLRSMRMSDTLRIAVVVRDRQAEALRVAGGLALADDTIGAFVLDR